MAVRSLLGGGSVIVRWVNAFPATKEMDHVAVSVVASLSAVLLPSMTLWPGEDGETH